MDSVPVGKRGDIKDHIRLNILLIEEMHPVFAPAERR